MRAVEKPEWLEVSVSDTGVGISTQDLPHVFERFYKVNKARGKTGTGLLYFFTGGLFLAGWICDLICILTGIFRDGEGKYLK